MKWQNAETNLSFVLFVAGFAWYTKQDSMARFTSSAKRQQKHTLLRILSRKQNNSPSGRA